MEEFLLTILWIGCWGGGLVLALYLDLLPAGLFLSGERWLTEQELRSAEPGQGWVARMLPPLLGVWFLAYAPVFLVAMLTCRNQLPVVLTYPALGCLWLYIPVGVLEVTARISVFVPFGRSRDKRLFFISSPRARRAGILRLALSAGIATTVCVLAYR